MNKRIANVPVIASSDYITSNGKFTAPEKNSLGVVKLNTDP